MALLEVVSWLVSIFGTLMSLGQWTQAWRIWKNKSAKNISWYTFGMFCVGNYIWLLYGILLNEWPIYIPFAVGAAGSTLVVILMVRYR